MTITADDKNFLIQFAYKPWLVDKVKELPGRRFNSTAKVWMVPREYRNAVIEFAQRYGFQFNRTIEEVVPGKFVVEPLPELTIDIPLKQELYPFQKNGVAYALKNKRCIFGDEPGLGKTAQSIAAITAADAFPCLVICPSSLKINWKREVEKWTDKKAMILEDRIKNSFPRYWEVGMAQFFIVNYESLKKYFVAKIEQPENKPLRLNHIFFKENINLFKSVIIDESHRVKSTATKQTKFTKGITQGKEYIFCLTGTPVVNKPKDLISQLGILERLEESFGNYRAFENRFCSGLKEASNLEELNYKLSQHSFFRRSKKDVLKDLPAKMRQVVYCEIDDLRRNEYNLAESDLREYLEKFKGFTQEQIDKSMRGEVMVRIQKLKNISARGKLKDVYEFIDDTIDSGEKLVVFGHLKEVVGAIREHYPGCVTITGDDKNEDRQKAIDAFQNNPSVKLCVCSIQAAGVGITLTASSRVAFVELGWHAAIHDQCEDRCHRIGQLDSVQCTYFLGKETIDEYIYELINSKRDMANTITGATNDVEVSVIDNIITLFNQPKEHA